MDRMFDYDLDLIFKEDQFCLTLTGKEFIFSSGNTFLEFLFKFGNLRRFKAISSTIHNIQYVGLMDMKSKEKFLVACRDLPETMDDDLIYALKDIGFLRILALYFIPSNEMTQERLRTTANTLNSVIN